MAGKEVLELIPRHKLHCAPGLCCVRGVGVLYHKEMCEQDGSTEFRKSNVNISCKGEREKAALFHVIDRTNT